MIICWTVRRTGCRAGSTRSGTRRSATVLAGFAAAAASGWVRSGCGRRGIGWSTRRSWIERLIAGFVEYGIVACDAAGVRPVVGWCGPDVRSRGWGWSRSLESNPMGAMHGVGVALAFGSDSPVTPLDPWGSVRAAAAHHNPAQRMSVRAAFAAHTRGGWRAVHLDDEGVLAPGGAGDVRGVGQPGRGGAGSAGGAGGGSGVAGAGGSDAVAGVPGHGAARRGDL